MTIAQLRTFCTVARLGSVRGAARELGVSEPAVSGALAALRRDLGDELCVRAPGGVELTAGGRRLAAAAAEILGLVDEARRSVREAGAERTSLRVVATPTAAEHAGQALVNAFTARVRTIDGDLGHVAASQFSSLLVERRVDATFGPRPEDTEGLGIRSLPILRWRAVVVAAPGHPLAGERGVPPAALARERWLMGPSPLADSSWTGAFLRRLRLDVADVRAFPSHAAALDAAAQGHGVKLAVQHGVRGALARGTLVALDVAGTPVPGEWHLATLTEHREPRQAALLRRWAASPEALQAMLAPDGGVPAQRFRPTLHVTLWS